MLTGPIQPISQRRSGFTLVELLVTIAIVIALAALAFIGAAGARKRAEMIVSVNRIKGINTANTLYAGDHAGRYCPIYTFDEDGKAGIHWHFNPDLLKNVVGEDNLEFLDEWEEHEGVSGIPEALLDPIVVRAKKKYWDRISASYGYNNENMPGGGFGGKNTSRGHTIGTVPDAASTCSFITCTDWIAKYGGRFIWDRQGYEGKTPDGKIAYRHSDKAIVTYYDGHTEMKSMEDIRALDRRGGKNNIFWGGDQQ